jgi:hypothetical protein
MRGPEAEWIFREFGEGDAMRHPASVDCDVLLAPYTKVFH